MTYKYKMLLAVLCLTLCGGMQAEGVPAYDNDSIRKYTIGEIVIESFKQNRGLYIEPISASLLTAKEIKAHNIANIKEFSAFIPNLFMPDYGSKMTSPVYIRGIGSRINSPSVALYVDGVPYFDRSTFDININDVEIMEVLRGPQGTIYGRNTMGGVINIFTKSPFLFQGTNVNFSAGSHNKYEVGASHYGKVDNKLGYSVSANYGHGGGYFKNHFTGKKADPIDEVSARARLIWRLTPRLRMDLTMGYEYSDQNGYPYRIYNTETGEVSKVNYNEPSYYKRNMSTNGLHVAYVTDAFKLSSQSSFQFFDGKQGLDQDFSPEDKFYVDFYQRQQMYAQEFNIKSLGEESKYDWQFGLFGFHQNYMQNNDTDYRQQNIHAVQSAKNPTYGYAVYHQSKVNDLLIKNLSFIFGFRYDWEHTKLTFEKGDDPLIKDKTSFSQVTPKFSLNYSFRNNGLVYFSVTRGYKTGGFNNTATGEDEKYRSFDPEYSWSYELGAKSSFFDNLLHLDMSLFWIDWRDQQISQKKFAGQGYLLRNAGRSESKGVEFTAQLNPVRNVEMQLSYGYTHATFKDYRNSDGEDAKDYDGNRLPMVPSSTFSLSASYTFDVNENWLDDIVLNGQYTGLGKIYWNEDNSVSQSYYDLLNAKMTFRKKDLSLDFWAKNIANKKYIAYHFSASGSDYIQQGKPFTCGVNVNLKF